MLQVHGTEVELEACRQLRRITISLNKLSAPDQYIIVDNTQLFVYAEIKTLK